MICYKGIDKKNIFPKELDSKPVSQTSSICSELLWFPVFQLLIFYMTHGVLFSFPSAPE